jgi:hypothetical protein
LVFIKAIFGELAHQCIKSTRIVLGRPPDTAQTHENTYTMNKAASLLQKHKAENRMRG